MKKTRKGNPMERWSMFDNLVTILVVFAVIITLYPMCYVLACSVSEPQYVVAGKVTLFPIGFQTDAYKLVLKNSAFVRALFNSVVYVVAGCLLMLFNTVAMAYPLTRPKLKFRKILNFYLLITMYFSGGMIPSFILVTKLGLYNSPWVLIIPSYNVWNIILCKTYMSSLPGELLDAAFIDGADSIKVLTKVVLPLSKPVLAVIMIYTIVGIWNSWFGASIYTTKTEIQPVQLYLRNLISQADMSAVIKEGMPKDMVDFYRQRALAANQLKYAMIAVVTLPIIMVYPLFQKHFTKGVMLGSLKG